LPLSHSVFAPHTVLQLPQKLLLLVRSTHWLPQRVRPAAQHMPFWQVPVPQLVPHVPQLLPSVSRLRQTPLQSSSPDGQSSWHTPFTHSSPGAHTVLQLPQ
jgi:hypothetical protein